MSIVERNELRVAVSKGNLTRFEYPKLTRFCQTQEEFAEVRSLSQSGKLWKYLSAGDLPESKWLTVFDTPKYKGSKIFLNMVKPQFVDECWLLFYRVYQEPPRNNEIYLKFATCFVYKRCSAAKADPKAHKIAWALFAKNVILSLKRNLVAWKRKVDVFRDTEATASTTSMIQTKKTSLQTRYGTLKGDNATTEQLAAVEAQIIVLSNAVKLIEGYDKIVDMKIVVESIERDVNLLERKLSCSLHYISFFENMMKQLASSCTLLLSLAFYAPEEGRTNRADFYSNCVACGELLAATNAIGVYILPCGHKYHRWYDAEGAYHMSFEIGRGYTKNVVGVEEGNVSDLGIAILGEDFDDFAKDLDGTEDNLSDRREEEDEEEEPNLFPRLVVVAVIQHALVTRRRLSFDPLGNASARSRVQPVLHVAVLAKGRKVTDSQMKGEFGNPIGTKAYYMVRNAGGIKATNWFWYLEKICILQKTAYMSKEAFAPLFQAERGIKVDWATVLYDRMQPTGKIDWRRTPVVGRVVPYLAAIFEHFLKVSSGAAGLKTPVANVLIEGKGHNKWPEAEEVVVGASKS
ncbi:hypothetical protein L7F22_068471 [Adiantum nelumboides]|nr:hypothetical protein [Adiantum nelumboides]